MLFSGKKLVEIVQSSQAKSCPQAVNLPVACPLMKPCKIALFHFFMVII